VRGKVRVRGPLKMGLAVALVVVRFIQITSHLALLSVFERKRERVTHGGRRAK
jgi:hypothetical protein